MRKSSSRISISRVNGSPTVRFVNTLVNKNKSENNGKAVEMLAIYCSELSDNKTTYVQKKVWTKEIKNYLYPPYVDCGYVE